MNRYNGHKSSAELEREVEAQRHRLEQTIDEIQSRLSPGQLIDQALSYTKHGGGRFATDLGHSITANPLPATLLGISLAWLMVGGRHSDGRDYDRTSYPLATTSSTGLQRVSHSIDETGDWYSEFVDDAGRKYRAKSDATGRRLGHFVDETGKLFSGFIDEAGHRVQKFRDESGNALDSASGWASETWHGIREKVSGGAGSVAGSAAHLGSDVRHRADRLGHTVSRTLEEQPLLAGALAFAAGAALAAALPHTRQEDEMVGAESDRLKDEAGNIAGQLYNKSKEQAAEVYEEAADKADEVYRHAKSTVAGEKKGSSDTRPVRH
jgi:cell division septum initiation protein DivIVA